MTDRGDWREVFRPDIPSPARVYDYLLGGKDHYPPDRVVAENLLRAAPHLRDAARQNRAFLRRATRLLAAEAGMRQFLDIGTGLPTEGQVHSIAQDVAPESRIVYVDNDPVVLAHGRDMLHAIDNTTIIRQDLREPAAILADPGLRRVLDLDRPVALLLVAVLHFLTDDDDPWSVVRALLDELPAGSHLVISHVTDDADRSTGDALSDHYHTTSTAHARDRAQVARFFEGLEMVDPGLVWAPEWHPDADTTLRDDPSRCAIYAGVARKV